MFPLIRPRSAPIPAPARAPMPASKTLRLQTLQASINQNDPTRPPLLRRREKLLPRTKRTCWWGSFAC